MLRQLVRNLFWLDANRRPKWAQDPGGLWALRLLTVSVLVIVVGLLLLSISAWVALQVPSEPIARLMGLIGFALLLLGGVAIPVAGVVAGFVLKILHG